MPLFPFYREENWVTASVKHFSRALSAPKWHCWKQDAWVTNPRLFPFNSAGKGDDSWDFEWQQVAATGGDVLPGVTWARGGWEWHCGTRLESWPCSATAAAAHLGHKLYLSTPGSRGLRSQILQHTRSPGQSLFMDLALKTGFNGTQ